MPLLQSLCRKDVVELRAHLSVYTPAVPKYFSRSLTRFPNDDGVSVTVGGGGAAAFNNLPIGTEEPLRLAHPDTITQQNPGVSAAKHIF